MDSKEIHLLKAAATVTEHCHCKGKCGAGTEVPPATSAHSLRESREPVSLAGAGPSGPAQAEEDCSGVVGTQLFLPI